MKTVAVHVERIVIEPQTGMPASTVQITAALQSAIARELAGCPRGGIPAAIERAMHVAFAAQARSRS